jgi:hypothetical protein
MAGTLFYHIERVAASSLKRGSARTTTWPRNRYVAELLSQESCCDLPGCGKLPIEAILRDHYRSIQGVSPYHKTSCLDVSRAGGDSPWQTGRPHPNREARSRRGRTEAEAAKCGLTPLIDSQPPIPMDITPPPAPDPGLGP